MHRFYDAVIQIDLNLARVEFENTRFDKGFDALLVSLHKFDERDRLLRDGFHIIGRASRPTRPRSCQARALACGTFRRG
jgi:hypothetical protein